MLNPIPEEQSNGSASVMRSLRKRIQDAVDRLVHLGSNTKNSSDDDLSGERFKLPEESVVETLIDHNGVLRQSTIIDELQWSASKGSRMLSEMEEREQIKRYRLGREKVVFLPGNEPEFLRPAHEETG